MLRGTSGIARARPAARMHGDNVQPCLNPERRVPPTVGRRMLLQSETQATLALGEEGDRRRCSRCLFCDAAAQRLRYSVAMPRTVGYADVAPRR